jgi:predicted nucleic acid-binding protein
VSFAVDTNVLLRSIDDGHPTQRTAKNALLLVRDKGETASIFPQNLIEFWTVATRPTANNGLGWSVDRAKQELASLKKLFVVRTISDATLNEWEGLVLRYGVIGKQAHDAHLVAAMLVHGISHLLTFNDADFKRFNEITVVNPQDIAEE